MITYTRTRWLSYAVQYSVIVTTESCWIWLSYEWTEMICESKNRRIWNILINYNYTAWLHHCYIRFNIANISLITWAKQTKACMPRMVELFSWLVSSFIHTGNQYSHTIIIIIMRLFTAFYCISHSVGFCSFLSLTDPSMLWILSAVVVQYF